MAVAGYLQYSTEIDKTGFESGLSTLESGVQSSGTRIKNIVAALGIDKIISKAMSTITSSVGSALDRIDTMEQFTRVMTVMLGSTEEAEEALVSINSIVKGTAYNLDVAAASAQSFVTSGMSIEKATEQVEVWGDAVAFYGDGTNETFERVTTAISQMSTASKVHTDDINTLTDVGIPVWQIYAEAVGSSVSEVREAVEAGEISGEEFTEVMAEALQTGTSSFAGISGMAKEAGASWQGTFDNFNAAITRGVKSIIDGIDEALENAGFETLRDMIADLGSKGEEALNGIADVIPTLVNNLGTIVPMITTVVTGFNLIDTSSITKLSKTVSSFTKGLGSNVAESTTKLSEFSLNWGEKFEEVSNSTKNKGGAIGNAISSITGKLSDLGLNSATTLSDMDSGVTSKIGNMISTMGGLSSKLVTGLGFGSLAGLALVGLGLLEDNFGDTINNLLTTATEKGPEIITNLVNGITTKIPDLITKGSELLQQLLDTIIANLPSIIEGGVQIITSLVTGLSQELPSLIPKMLEVVLTMVDGLISNLDQLISAGIDLIIGLAEGLINAIPTLISYIPQIITSLVTGIINLLPKIISAGITLLINLGVGLITAIPQLIAMIPQIISAIKEAFTNINWGELGKNIIQGIANGLGNAVNVVKNAITNVCKSMLNSIKSFFGISSPSKLMRDEIGKFIPQGVAVGIEADTDTALEAIDDMNDEIMNEMNKAVAYETGSISTNASVKSNNSMLNVIDATFNLDSSIVMNEQKVGRIVTPYVTKTIKTGGIS